MIDISSSSHHVGDCRDLLAQLPEGCIQTCITSPPYWGLRDYGHEGQIGLEETPEEYVATMVEVFRGVRRALRDDGTLWLNLGDCYFGTGSGPQAVPRSGVTSPVRSGGERPGACTAPAHGPWESKLKLKPGDLVGIPWMVAFALRDDGWWLRSDVIWSKPNPMPESVKNRPTKAHEYIFLLGKSAKYFYDVDATREPQKTRGERHEGRSGYRDGHPSKVGNGIKKRSLHPLGKNKRSVWTVASQPYAGAHFATFPTRLIEPCVLAGARRGDIVLDPFFGSGTTGEVAQRHGRRWIGFDLGYAELAADRTRQCSLLEFGMTSGSASTPDRAAKLEPTDIADPKCMVTGAK